MHVGLKECLCVCVWGGVVGIYVLLFGRRIIV